MPQQSMLRAAHEIAIYVHRFHNLDLFQQGWYQIKITSKWEDGDYGTPSRVFQYEAPELGSEYICGMWRVDETDFFTQPFRIRYARQDVFLSVMVCFNLPITKHVGPSSPPVILKFELFYAPILEKGFNLQDSFDTCPAAVHEFRLPPEALLGLHSFCPVHFDTFHAILLDVSVHISLLQGSAGSSGNVPSDSFVEDVFIEDHDNSTKALLKGLLTACSRLLAEVQKMSNAIYQDIDINDFHWALEDNEPSVGSASDNLDVSVEMPINKQSDPEKCVGVSNLRDEVLDSLSKDELLSLFHSFGNRVLYLWGIFQKFHRHLWIYMIIRNQDYESVPSGIIPFYIGCNFSSCIYPEQPVQTATKRAELHRQSISQMRITSCSIQDMQIFGDLLRTPIVIVERYLILPFPSSSGNSYSSNPDPKQTDIKLSQVGSKPIKKIGSLGRSGHVLKIVVFVHGFQASNVIPLPVCCNSFIISDYQAVGHHLDLRLIRNQWLLIEPKIHFLMSEANEEKTSGDFREMGLRLAQEVTSYLKKKMDKVTRSGDLESIKLSFVGHSLGNIIIRAALTESIMEPYLRYLYTYVSVSGPHLGYLYSSNSLFNSGLWVLKKLKGTQCIHQLTFSDDPDIKNTFLYKLCQQKTLESFRNIILLASPQDGYVPYHSARIEMCQASSIDNTRKGILFIDMLNNCLDQMYAPPSSPSPSSSSSSREQHCRVVMRCDVCFDMSLQGRNLDTVIGRAAHIEFLESDIYAKFIMWSFPELFR
ncbi:hypothetical protein DM860_011362 [Cuscuta australis]|uniref:DUF676 domain-containing protein n=1 Tax=Cuscuta australis TaxID=267555 RepID=A0A328DPT3_9ASTE|nr:hypothetical protein DM860_011362 [Cuscuta australis]